MKKYSSTVLMILMLALISGFITYFSAAYDFAGTEDMYYNSFRSSHAKLVLLSPSNPDKAEAGDTVICPDFSQLGDNFSLSRIVVGTGIKDSQSFRGIYSKGDIYEPPLLEGRYLTQEEIESGAYVAVAGKTVYDSCETDENGDKTVSVLGLQYRIVGCIGTGYETRIDNLVIFPLYSFLSVMPADGLYSIDAKDEATARDITNRFMGFIMTDPKYSTVFEVEYQESKNTAIFLSGTNGMMFVFALILIVLNTFSLCSASMDEMKHSMAIRKLVGVSAIRAIGEQVIKYTLIAVAGYLIGTICLTPIIYRILDMVNKDIYLQLNPGNILISFTVTVVFFIIMVVPFVLKIYRVDTSAELKGKE